MITVERRFEVAVPPEVVFDYLQDFTHTEQWDPGTVTTTRTDTGPLREGATFHNVSEFRGRRTELDYELKRHQPHQHLVFTGKNKTVTATDDLSFAKTAGGTAITYRATFDFHGLAKLAEPFLRKGFQPIADETVEKLTRTLESLPR